VQWDERATTGPTQRPSALDGSARPVGPISSVLLNLGKVGYCYSVSGFESVGTLTKR